MPLMGGIWKKACLRMGLGTIQRVLNRLKLATELALLAWVLLQPPQAWAAPVPQNPAVMESEVVS